MTLDLALDKLRSAGEVRLVRSHWCVREGGEWRDLIPPELGLRLVARRLAVLAEGGKVLRPA